MAKPLTRVQSDLSTNYVSAIVTKAGFTFNVVDESNDFGIDGAVNHVTTFNGKYDDSGPCFLVQIKSTINFTETDENINYVVRRDAYFRLKHKTTLPKILIVLFLPKEDKDWLVNDHESLKIFKSAYWFKPCDLPEINEQTQVTISISKENLLTPEFIEKYSNECLKVIFGE